jgi:hypothetical protein
MIDEVTNNKALLAHYADAFARSPSVSLHLRLGRGSRLFRHRLEAPSLLVPRAEWLAVREFFGPMHVRGAVEVAVGEWECDFESDGEGLHDAVWHFPEFRRVEATLFERRFCTADAPAFWHRQHAARC